MSGTKIHFRITFDIPGKSESFHRSFCCYLLGMRFQWYTKVWFLERKKIKITWENFPLTLLKSIDTLFGQPAELSNRLFPCAGDGGSVTKNSSQIRLFSGKQFIGKTIGAKMLLFLDKTKTKRKHNLKNTYRRINKKRTNKTKKESMVFLFIQLIKRRNCIIVNK